MVTLIIHFPDGDASMPSDRYDLKRSLDQLDVTTARFDANSCLVSFEKKGAAFAKSLLVTHDDYDLLDMYADVRPVLAQALAAQNECIDVCAQGNNVDAECVAECLAQ